MKKNYILGIALVCALINAILAVIKLPFVLAIVSVATLLGLLACVIQKKTTKEGEEVTKREEDKVTAIINSLEDAVIMYDQNFKITNINPAAEQLFKITKEEVVGKEMNPGLMKEARLTLLTQVVFPSLAPSVTQTSGEGWPQVVEMLFNEPSLKLKATLHRITNNKGGTIGFLKIIHDGTREKNILESKTEFVTVAAHQLRTPLTAINWAFEHLLSAIKDNPEVEKVIQEGKGLAERSLKIVNDLLDAAKIEEGRFGSVLEETDLKKFLEDVVNQASPIAKELAITLSLSPFEKDCKVKIDQGRLGMALFNLLDNAIRYNTKNGSVTILVEPLEKSVIIRIRDTGVGIPAQELKKMFTKFYRGSNVVQLQPNGSGLGLFITKNIIESHNGKIEVESVVNRGTTFLITLPLVKKG